MQISKPSTSEVLKRTAISAGIASALPIGAGAVALATRNGSLAYWGSIAAGTAAVGTAAGLTGGLTRSALGDSGGARAISAGAGIAGALGAGIGVMYVTDRALKGVEGGAAIAAIFGAAAFALGTVSSSLTSAA
jgi:hypothetical protein